MFFFHSIHFLHSTLFSCLLRLIPKVFLSALYSDYDLPSSFAAVWCFSDFWAKKENAFSRKLLLWIPRSSSNKSPSGVPSAEKGPRPPKNHQFFWSDEKWDMNFFVDASQIKSKRNSCLEHLLCFHFFVFKDSFVY